MLNIDIDKYRDLYVCDESFDHSYKVTDDELTKNEIRVISFFIGYEYCLGIIRNKINELGYDITDALDLVKRECNDLVDNSCSNCKFMGYPICYTNNGGKNICDDYVKRIKN